MQQWSYARKPYFLVFPPCYLLVNYRRYRHKRLFYKNLQSHESNTQWQTVPTLNNWQCSNLQAYVFSGDSGACAAFLVNTDSRTSATVRFQNLTYQLPPKSISILPDCNIVAFNTAKVPTYLHFEHQITFCFYLFCFIYSGVSTGMKFLKKKK